MTPPLDLSTLDSITRLYYSHLKFFYSPQLHSWWPLMHQYRRCTRKAGDSRRTWCDVRPCLCSTGGQRPRLIMRSRPHSPITEASVITNEREEERPLSRVNGARHLTLSAPISAQRGAHASTAQSAPPPLVTCAAFPVFKSFISGCGTCHSYSNRPTLTSIPKWPIQTWKIRIIHPTHFSLHPHY